MKSQPSIGVELIHIHGPMKGRIQEFTEGCISIGRHPSCSLHFPSDDLNSISRKHAEIIREGNRFKLLDHSTNGTYLNGRKVTEAYLKDGDVLEFSEGGPKVSFITKQGGTQDEPLPPETDRDVPELQREESVPEAGGSSSEKVIAPLVIQYGPSLRTYRQLPVTIGNDPACDFVIMDQALLARHAEIIFAQNKYWIKDLTGQRLVQVNNSPIPFQAPLNAMDLISLAPQGPKLCFLGEGRLAEAAEPEMKS